MGELYDFATDQTRRSKQVCATRTSLTSGPGIHRAGHYGGAREERLGKRSPSMSPVSATRWHCFPGDAARKSPLNIPGMESGIDARALKTRRIDEDDQPSTHRDGRGELTTRGCAGIDGEIRTRCLRHVAEHRPLAVVIAGLSPAGQALASIKAPRELQVSEIARGLERAGDGVELYGDRASCS